MQSNLEPPEMFSGFINNSGFQVSLSGVNVELMGRKNAAICPEQIA